MKQIKQLRQLMQDGVPIKEIVRRKGLGSFLIQELKKECYQSGRVPTAQCRIDNTASRATLLKAGLAIAGYLLSGSIKH